MEVNLKHKLPQEGTGCLTVGESLGGPSGSSCPSYSGEGKDRFRLNVPRNRKTKQLSEIPESSCPTITKSPSLELTSSEDRIASEVNVSESVVEEKVLALELNRHIIRNMEEQCSSTLQAHVLDGVVIVEMIAALTVKPQDRRTLQNAALKIKNMLVQTMNHEAKRIVTRSRLLLLRRELVENKEIVSRSQGLKCTNSSRAESGSKKNNNVSEVKNLIPAQRSLSYITNDIPVEQENQQLKVENELEYMVQTLTIKKLDLGKLEDQSTTALHKYMLDSVAIIKKVAIVIGDAKDQLALEYAAFNIKQAVEGLLKLSDPMAEIHIENNVSEKNPPGHTKQPESLTPRTPDVEQIKQLGGEKLTSFLKKYLENTIDEYLNACENRFLNEWEVQTNANMDSTGNAPADKENNKSMKRKIESRALSPAPEPVYDVWYEMDQFKDFALNRIERDVVNKASRKWFSEPDKNESDAPTNKDSGQEAVRLLRPQPQWWNAELAELKRVCLAARRQYSRSRRRRQRDEEAEMELYAVYRSLKKTLNAAIKRAKSEQQEENEGYSESSQES